MKGLQKPRELAPHIGDDFVGVDRHQTPGVHEHPVGLGRVAEAIPIGLLQLPRFVRVEEEVAPRRAARQRPKGRISLLAGRFGGVFRAAKMNVEVDS